MNNKEGEIMKCKRCGTCCKSTFFVLRDVPIEEDTREIGRWASYHGVQIMKRNIDGIDYLAVNLPGECKFLIKENNIYTCAIYPTRPQICKTYFCDKSKEIMGATK